MGLSTVVVTMTMKMEVRSGKREKERSMEISELNDIVEVQRIQRREMGIRKCHKKTH